MGVLPFPHGPDAAQERPHPAGEKRRKGPEQGQHRQADHHGDEPQVPLQFPQQGPLVPVGLIEADGPDDPVPVHHRPGPPAGKEAVLIGAGKGVVPPQGGDDLPGEGVFPRHAVFLAVIEDQAGPIRN